jgi:uncharacterized membrane protein
VSLSYLLVLLLCGSLFNESVTVAKLAGAALIVSGLIMGSQSC